MEDFMPQDEYFEWEDLIAYNAPSGMDEDYTNAHLDSLTDFPASYPVSKQLVLGNRLDGDSWWSDEESNISTTSLTALPDSHPTFLSLSVTTVCQTQTNDIVFPEYDTISSYSSAEDISSDDTSSQASQEEGSSIESDDEDEIEEYMSLAGPTPIMSVERTCDDIETIRRQPSRHVDYFSQEWSLEDVSASWRHLASKPDVYKHHERLENASWRAWAKIRQQLGVVTPKSINWLKDIDDTSLYGPFQLGINSQTTTKISNSIRYSKSTPTSPTTSIKSVLKKPTTRELLLRGSIPSLYTQFPLPQPKEVVITPPRPIHVPFKKMLARASSGSFKTQSTLQPRVRKVFFREEVEQFTSLETPEETKPEPHHWPRKFSFSNLRESLPSYNKTVKHTKTIEKLPPTTLRNIKRQRKALNGFGGSKSDPLKPDVYEWQDGHPAADLSDWHWMGADNEKENELDWISSSAPGPRTYLTDLIHQTRNQVVSQTHQKYNYSPPQNYLPSPPDSEPAPRKAGEYLPLYHNSQLILPSTTFDKDNDFDFGLQDVLSAEEAQLLEELDMSSMSSMSSPETGSEYQSSPETGSEYQSTIDTESEGGMESPDITDMRKGARGLDLGGVDLSKGMGGPEVPRIVIFEPGRGTLFERVMGGFEVVV